MDYNVVEQKEKIRSEVERMLDFVTNEAAQEATADHIERSLFTLLLKLGAELLLLFFRMRSQSSERDTIFVNEQTVPYNSEQKREYFSIFGKVPFWRPYFYSSASGGHTPLDAVLRLGADRYSDLLRETLDYLAVYVPFNKAVDIVKRILQFGISTRVQQKLVSEDAADVLAYYEQKAPPTANEEAEILVIQSDGKGVPMILEKPSTEPLRLGKGQKRGRKKEAIVTAVYTIASKPRSPEEVLKSFFQEEKALGKDEKAPPKPQNKEIWATLDGKAVALARLGLRVAAREGAHIMDRVALADGCECLQDRIKETFPNFTLILDFIHANEYLWKVANSFFGEKNERRLKWVKEQTELMLSGKTGQVIEVCRSLAKKKSRSKKQVEQLLKTANYFERNLAYMAYDRYLAKGWPIASGVIEGACRHFVKDRLEMSGMRWEQRGAENLLGLRAAAENDDWDEYHQFRRQQCYQRLYGFPSQTQYSLEMTALNLSPQEANSQLGGRHKQPTVLLPSSDEQAASTEYHALPLAR